MIIKKISDHTIIQTITCGEIREILKNNEYSGLDLAIAIDINSTKPHFHTKFTEIYVVLDGHITIKTFEPTTNSTTSVELHANELCVLLPHVHHCITNASPKNRLCIISTPAYIQEDEVISDKI